MIFIIIIDSSVNKRRRDVSRQVFKEKRKCVQKLYFVGLSKYKVVRHAAHPLWKGCEEGR